MKTIAIVSAIALAASSTFALTLFKDLNMAGNAISNVGGIKLSEGAKLENVASIQFASGQVMSNTSSADIRYPDGYDGDLKLIRVYQSSIMYTVTVGKTLYVTSGVIDSSNPLYAMTNGGSFQSVWYFNSASYQYYYANTFRTPLAFPERTILRTDSYNLYLTGFEVPKGADVQVLRIDTSTGYTVPAGKTFYLLTGRMDSAYNLYAYKGGVGYRVWYFHEYNCENYYSKQFDTPLRFESGVQLKSDNGYCYVTGYLK